MDDDEQEGRLARKMRESPLMVIGMAGWCGVVAYGLYGIKKRKLPLAMHLIHTRVIAQACVVSALSLGVGYKLYHEHISPMIWPEAANANNNASSGSSSSSSDTN